MKKKIYSCMDDYDPNSIFIEDALKQIKKISKKINSYEYVNLLNANNRIVYENIKSRIKVPNYDNSAMDGYALNIKDTKNNNVFTVVGTSLAGIPFKGKIKKNECVKIMTGAVIPYNCNIVIMKEETESDKKSIIITSKKIKIKQNIRFSGEDITPNKVIVKKNHIVNSSSMGLLASQGINKIKVFKNPVVSFFTSGDEVVAIDKKLPYGKVYDSNRYTLTGMLDKNNIKIIDLGHAKDNIKDIKNKFYEAIKKSDIVISTGGVSVGDADYIKEVVKTLGDINFWKVAVKPGRPLAFGKIKDTIFFGLPGNPVSVMVTFLLFVLPSINMLSGRNFEMLFKDAILQSDIRKRKGRAEFQRGLAQYDNGKIYVESVGEQGSGILSSMNKANCLIYLSVEQGSLKVNDSVKIIKFKDYI
ncbi:MAG: molybdopterin molybdotransferase MoeA [Gammaproteobacteria bacterium]|jgi:molybdopterin molybdotransferase|nr:molybdopterin molybdotransferase MoeA [Gammaproteobacteria bacterium]MBT6755212.1 molybdopterin molybdotransferase MoeA [Gammaproteobacteria bacterium]MBT7523429.1 molybdopterin molybdotransferase MoeA [Gammaproteobacteria bacterium]MBT7814789.1 molybdopterin molybdotransferase MoeA [Gammaproteobacteria bacterium]